jgi:hypothetical protein
MKMALENVNQARLMAVKAFMSKHAALFRRQGSVQRSWRYFHGRRLGPFFRLVFRVSNKLTTIYLGRCGSIADEIRALLNDLRRDMRERANLEMHQKQARKALRLQKRVLDEELRKRGFYLKGYEVRGWKRIRNKPGFPS